MKNILVTGGLGYIGSHTCAVLIDAGFAVSIVDNLSNSRVEVIDKIELITKIRPRFFNGDIRDLPLLEKLFREQTIDAVIHFAGLKSVGESVNYPVDYYDNNVNGSVTLLTAMKNARINTIVYSSSAAVYGEPEMVPLQEVAPCRPASPYGRSKLMVEEILFDLTVAEPDWSIARLRYFNPVGAHESGLLGEDPEGVPENLMPYIVQVAAGLQEKLRIFGDDYPTPDGSGVRDYIHVMDLAEGHLAALRHCQNKSGLLTVNMGTGHGVTVKQMIEAFEGETGQKVPYEVVGRRAGDVAQCWADTTLAKQVLGWTAKKSLRDMCSDAWRRHCLNPIAHDNG